MSGVEPRVQLRPGSAVLGNTWTPIQMGYSPFVWLLRSSWKGRHQTEGIVPLPSLAGTRSQPRHPLPKSLNTSQTSSHNNPKSWDLHTSTLVILGGFTSSSLPRVITIRALLSTQSSWAPRHGLLA